MPQSAPVQYTHHFSNGKTRPMTVINEEHKGHHREHCLCFAGCKFFKPDTAENCSIAQKLYNLDRRCNVVTPVYECDGFATE